jgi:hypothetical protein
MSRRQLPRRHNQRTGFCSDFLIEKLKCHFANTKQIAARAYICTGRRGLCRSRSGCSWRRRKCTRRFTRGCTAGQFPKMMMIAPLSPSRMEKLKLWRATFLSSCRSLGLKSRRAWNFSFSFQPIKIFRLAAARLFCLQFPNLSVSDNASRFV